MRAHFREFHGPSDWGWVLLHLPGLKRVEDTGGIMCIDLDTNETVAGVVFDTWTHSSVCVHQIVTNPMVLRHGFFEEVADYVFNVAEREVMVGLVPANNEKALKLNEKIGFKECGRVPDAIMLGLDLIIMQVHKEDCTFWTPQAEPVAATG